MIQNKKFGLTTLLGIVLPIFVSFYNYYSSNIRNFEWGYDNRNNINTIAIVISIMTCFLILKLNNKSQIFSSIWRTVIITLLVVLILYFLLILSFNFGF